MIYLVLDAFITKNKIQYVQLFIAILTIFFLIMGLWVKLVFLICTLICVITHMVILKIQECKKRKNVKNRFQEYNCNLDRLVSILRSFKTSDFSNKSWYSSEGIKYLIQMCDFLICNKSKKDKGFEIFKTAMLPIIGFIAAVFADKATLETNLTIWIIAIFIVVACYFVYEITALIYILLFKSNDPEEITRLKMSLMDLLLRDFSETVELDFKVKEI